MKTIHILLVEDNEGDILLTSEALEEGKFNNKLSVARDGKQAIEFLEKKGNYLDAETPDLILLDVNLPKKNGYQVLHHIKASDHLKRIPVIMLTTSSSPKDINQAYENYASSYITKPLEAQNFVEVIESIENFYLGVVKLPCLGEI